MNKTGLIVLLLAAGAACLVLENEERCKTKEIEKWIDQLANETMPDIADESIQKLEKSLSDLYDKVETIIKPIEVKQEQIVADNDKLIEKFETLITATPQPESSRSLRREYTQLINETVTDIVENSMNILFEKVKTYAVSDQLGVSPRHPATSCKEILLQNRYSTSDYYWLRASNGYAVRVFCDMTHTCGGVTGGWMKIAELDTTKFCPHPLTRNTQYGKNLCARKEAAGGCSEVNYQTNGIAYNEVCGRVIGYQFGSTDGPANFNGAGINGAFIDGVSLSHGNPRQHIWSFLAALDEYGHYPRSKCSCIPNGINPPPSFVGTDYFCDTASRNALQYPYIFYPNDPLWDGSGCGPNSNCCTFQNPPWFYKNLGASTNNNISMRLCRDQEAADEDVLLENVDIFVR